MTCTLVTPETGFAREAAGPITVTDRGVIVTHSPPATFFEEIKSQRTPESLSEIS